MHHVVVGIGNLHRLKCACANMQGNECSANAACRQCIEQFGGEMQPRGRGGDGAIGRGVDGLVAFGIFGGILARDVGRQRHMAIGAEFFDKLCMGIGKA